MVEPCQDLDLSQGSLAVSLMLKRTYFLDGNLIVKDHIKKTKLHYIETLYFRLGIIVIGGHHHSISPLPNIL